MILAIAFLFVAACAFIGGVIVGAKLPSPAKVDSEGFTNTDEVYWDSSIACGEVKATKPKRKGKGKRKK